MLASKELIKNNKNKIMRDCKYTLKKIDLII